MNDDLKRWDEEAEDWSQEIVPKRAHSKVITENELLRLVGDVQGKKILDAGCGEGRYSALLADRGAKMVGVDGSPNMVGIAKQNFPGIEFKVADLLNPLEFESAEFDVIISIVVVVSLKEIETFLRESYRVLKDDGSLIISTLHPAFSYPVMKFYKTLWEKIFRKPVNGLVKNYFQTTQKRKEDYAKQPWPYYHRTIEEYSSVFKGHGFLIEEISEPHLLPKEFLDANPQFEYATRLPRFMFFKLVKRQ